MKQYFLYILKCSDKTLYTGITVDLVRRIKEHNSSKLGAKYTRARRPVKLVYNKLFKNRSLATKAELAVKKMTRSEKLFLIKSFT
ncbi:MAG: Endo/excinuclease amino terminal domain protein [Parcubacteria group bacterium GW2011_GWC2_38_7]|nr:MAG: Endo/excinuclease amino terminal domain protein [Parcubacteria group bacterium GW2011_GWC2_38_7]